MNTCIFVFTNTLNTLKRLAFIMVFYSAGRTTTYPEKPPTKGFQFHYLGGGDEVGNVGIILEDSTGTRILLDYGLAPTRPPKYPNEAPRVTDAIMTHSHIDHIGMAPWLSGNYQTRLHGTHLTAALSEMMWHDCYKVSSIEKYPLSWDKRDIDLALASWNCHQFHEPWTHHNWQLTLLPAGHIPGAAMLHIQTNEYSILITGDFDSRDSPLCHGAKPTKCDILFVEGTYGGRKHPSLDEELNRFLTCIDEVHARGGTVLIPAFANGRTQDVLLYLHQHRPHLNVHIDGMGKRVGRLHLEHPSTLRNVNALEQAWAWSRRVSSKSDKKKALEADVIITTSGMLEGGPALWYLNRLRHDERNAVFFTGYQASGTGGRSLLEHGVVEIYGNEVEITLETQQFSFSTHAGHQEIVEFATACGAQHVVVYHTDPSHARPPLVEELTANGHQVHQPKNGMTYIIE